MDIIGRKMLGGEENIEKRNLIWNMLGSAVYAVTSMMLGIAVTRILGDREGGIFFFAFSTLGQQLYIVSYFGMRPVQITDMSFEYTFGDYRFFRILSAGVAITGLAVYTVLYANSTYIAWIWSAMVGYKILDGLADCYETEYQRQGRLYMTGKSNLLRTLFSVGIFLPVLFLTRNALIGAASFIIAGILSVYLFAIRPLRLFPKVDYRRKAGTYRTLFHLSKWLFLSSFIDIYVFAAAKYAVNDYLGNEANAYFSLIFIPTSVINLMAGFIIRPALTGLALKYETGHKKEFIGGIRKISIVISAFTILGMIGGKLFGIRTLAFMLGRERGTLLLYENALILLILGGGFYALLNLLYYTLVILKQRRAIFTVYTIAAIAAYFVSGYMTEKGGIDGAAMAYLILMLMLSFMFFAVFIKALFLKEKF